VSHTSLYAQRIIVYTAMVSLSLCPFWHSQDQLKIAGDSHGAKPA